MKFENLIVALQDGILKITVNRETKLNALNQKTLEELGNAIQRAYDEPEVRGVLLTGAGTKAFVAGADISEFSVLNSMNGRKFAEAGQEVMAKFENCPKPVVAVVNGYALGGGCELAMACHIRFAATEAFFGLPEVKLGIIPGYGGTQRLPMLVGKAKAFELILSGEMVNAEEALRIGLVNHVYPREEVLAKAESLLHSIFAKAPLAIAQAIDSINAFYTSEDGYQAEANAFGNCCKSEDFKEGTTAFLEKRKANFKGK